jgi:hypothetical protein
MRDVINYDKCWQRWSIIVSPSTKGNMRQTPDELESLRQRTVDKIVDALRAAGRFSHGILGVERPAKEGQP